MNEMPKNNPITKSVLVSTLEAHREDLIFEPGNETDCPIATCIKEKYGNTEVYVTHEIIIYEGSDWAINYPLSKWQSDFISVFDKTSLSTGADILENVEIQRILDLPAIETSIQEGGK